MQSMISDIFSSLNDSPKKADKLSNEELLVRYVMEFDSIPVHLKDGNIQPIIDLASLCQKEFVSEVCRKARDFNYIGACHVLLLNLIKRPNEDGPKASHTIVDVMRHPQEMIDFLTMYMRNGRQPRSKQMDKGLQMSFSRFSETQFKECSWKGPWTIRDVMYCCRPKPMNEERARLYDKIARNRL